MYLTYLDYVAMGGTLEDTAFDLLAFEAEAMIDNVTFNRLHKMKPEEYPEVLPRLMFQLISIAQFQQQALSLGATVGSDNVVSGNITSQSNDGYSTTFNSISASSAFQAGATQANQLIKNALRSCTDTLGRNLLYRGVYPNE